MSPYEDEPLHHRALERLGPLASTLAREALESAIVEVEPEVLAWTGTSGTVRGHLVLLWVEPSLASRVNGAPSALDELTAAIAAAVATEEGNALAELKVVARKSDSTPVRASPYRGRH